MRSRVSDLVFRVSGDHTDDFSISNDTHTKCDHNDAVQK